MADKKPSHDLLPFCPAQHAQPEDKHAIWKRSPYRTVASKLRSLVADGFLEIARKGPRGQNLYRRTARAELMLADSSGDGPGPLSAELEEFARSWAEALPGQWLTRAELFRFAEDGGLLRETLGEGPQHTRRARFGRALWQLCRSQTWAIRRRWNGEVTEYAIEGGAR